MVIIQTYILLYHSSIILMFIGKPHHCHHHNWHPVATECFQGSGNWGWISFELSEYHDHCRHDYCHTSSSLSKRISMIDYSHHHDFHHDARSSIGASTPGSSCSTSFWPSWSWFCSSSCWWSWSSSLVLCSGASAPSSSCCDNPRSHHTLPMGCQEKGQHCYIIIIMITIKNIIIIIIIPIIRFLYLNKAQQETPWTLSL